jgi:hypothetical protein
VTYVLTLACRNGHRFSGPEELVRPMNLQPCPGEDGEPCGHPLRVVGLEVRLNVRVTKVGAE